MTLPKPISEPFVRSNEEWNEVYAFVKNDRDQALARLEKAKQALEFYANGDYSTCEAVGDYHSPMDEEGGKRAREVLKEIGE